MIKYFMQKIGFPEDAVNYLYGQYNALMQNEQVKQDFLVAYDKLFNRVNGGVPLDITKKVAEYTGVNSHVVDMVFVLSALPALKCVCISHGFSEEHFWNNMRDLTYKLKECYAVHGIWGTFVANWYRHFFDLKISTHGRLQFEEITAPFDYKTVKAGTFALNCHIPNAGPLTADLVKDSFKKVYDAYKDRFADGIVPIYCHSWLLYPPFLEKLKDGSNIKNFAKNFDIVNYHQNPANGDFWRVFNVFYSEGITKQVVADNSLKRTIIELIESGDSMGAGNGVILLDGKFD